MLKQEHIATLPEYSKPAAFGRLCVETPRVGFCQYEWQPAAFGRLCVETAHAEMPKAVGASRLRAAVC